MALTLTYGTASLINSGAASGTVAGPSCAVGDLLVLVVAYGGGSPVLGVSGISGGSGTAWTEKTGWPQGGVNNTGHAGQTIATKVAASGDSAATFSVSFSQSTRKAIMWVIVASDVSTPSTGAGSCLYQATAATALATNQITVAAGSLVLAVFNNVGGTAATFTPGSMTGTATGLTATEKDDQANTGSSQVAAELQDGNAAVTGGGTVAAAATSSASLEYCAGILEIVPGGVSATAAAWWPASRQQRDRRPGHPRRGWPAEANPDPLPPPPPVSLTSRRVVFRPGPRFRAKPPPVPQPPPVQPARRRGPRPLARPLPRQVVPAAQVAPPPTVPPQSTWPRRQRLPARLPWRAQVPGPGAVTQPLPALARARPRALLRSFAARIRQQPVPAQPPVVQRKPSRLTRPARRPLASQPAPPQVVTAPPAIAPSPARSRAWPWFRRARPGQVVPSAGVAPAAAAPAPAGPRSRRWLFMRRGRTAQLAPPQVITAPPPAVPQPARPRPRPVLFRRRAVPAPQPQQAPLASPRARPRFPVPRARRPVSVPQQQPGPVTPPLRRRVLPPKPRRQAQRVPPQVIIPPAVPAPAGARPKRWLPFLRRLVRAVFTPPPVPPPVFAVSELSAGPPHGAWAALAPYETWEARGPHGMFSTLAGRTVYTAGEPHGEDAPLGPHG